MSSVSPIHRIFLRIIIVMKYRFLKRAGSVVIVIEAEVFVVSYLLDQDTRFSALGTWNDEQCEEGKVGPRLMHQYVKTLLSSY